MTIKDWIYHYGIDFAKNAMSISAIILSIIALILSILKKI